jgi:arylsulfatase A-like enzyme
VDRSIAVVVLIGVAACGVVGCNATDGDTQPESKRPPNIVLLVADDLGYGEPSSYGGRVVSTPHIDSIGEGGVRFTDGYVTAPVCNPSRAGFFSGRYQQRWGQEFNPGGKTGGDPPIGALPLSEATIAEALHDAGYATGFVGKWHLGVREDLEPGARGFDEVLFLPRGRWYIDPAKPGVHAAPGRAGRGRGGNLLRNGQPVQVDELVTEVLGREGVEFIERHREEPFFLYLPFHVPHTPLQTTQKYYDRFPDIDNEFTRIYAAMISALDDAIGGVLQKLEETGLADDTLVIFFSDNGAAQYVPGASNAPLTGHKRLLYEGGIRIPFAIRWPARLPAGEVYSHPVSALDIFPTALAAAGVTDIGRPDLDGVDLLPYLTGEDQASPHAYLFWRMGPNAAVRSGRWKLLRIGEETVRLYDLPTDIAEENDVAKDNPEVVKRLVEALARWNSQLAEPRWGGRTVETNHAGDTIEWHF